MTEPILQTKSVTKVFGGLTAVKDVSFDVRAGEIFGIAGPNGSGKSTLFNIITSIPFTATSGEIYFKGERIDRRPPYRIAQSGLCRTFQKDAEFPDLSARETLLVSAVYNGRLRGSEAAARVNAALERVEFSAARSDLPSRDLSIYEKKQLMIASALACDPAVLMLDEPASGLTKPEIGKLDDLLVGLNRSGITIVLIEHVLSLLLSVSQRLMVLNYGEILAAGAPADVVKDPAVIEAYLGARA